jgi:ATP phosphoribosyltransferase
MAFLADSLSDRLLFAIPKKGKWDGTLWLGLENQHLLICLSYLGRLYEKCLEVLSGADIQFSRSNRLDVCLVGNHQMAL